MGKKFHRSLPRRNTSNRDPQRPLLKLREARIHLRLSKRIGKPTLKDS